MIDRLRAGLDRLLGGTVDARALAVFRVLLGFSVWIEARENVGRLTQYTAGQYHVRYLGLDLNWSVDQLHGLCEWQMRFALMIVLGLFTRVFALAAFVCQASMFLVSQLNFRNHIFFMLVLLVVTALSASDRAWSVRHVFERLRGNTSYDARTAPAFGPRFVQMQVLFIYFYSGLHKLLLGFGNGYALCRFLGRELPRGRSADLLGSEAQHWVAEQMSQDACVDGAPSLIVIGSIGTIVGELFLAGALAFRPTVFVAIVLGLGLHGVIFVSMDVVTFGVMMVAAYPLFAVSPPGSVMRGVWPRGESAHGRGAEGHR